MEGYSLGRDFGQFISLKSFKLSKYLLLVNNYPPTS